MLKKISAFFANTVFLSMISPLPKIKREAVYYSPHNDSVKYIFDGDLHLDNKRVEHR